MTYVTSPNPCTPAQTGTQPSTTVRVRICPMSATDQRKASMTSSDVVTCETAKVAAVTKGGKNSVGMAKPTCFKPSSEICRMLSVGSSKSERLKSMTIWEMKCSRVLDCLK